ncbi:hypothetical protein L1987_35348 [Smallanthus sonchifolius]|uniref:Uncharacterized protein n=1 Tax=Smallanthus sonchifolius TaxID=185202 RepID=A0ACB9HXK5_9ASTR|nr:hypothetical protein L1987_35348 [Smallanthus sonchifolius]
MALLHKHLDSEKECNRRLQEELKKDGVTAQLDTLRAEKCSHDNLVRELETRLNSIQVEHVGVISSFDNVQKVINELKLKVMEMEREVVRQREVIADRAEEKREVIRQLSFSLEHYIDPKEASINSFESVSVFEIVGLVLMEGGGSNSPSPPDDSQINEHSLRLAENVEAESYGQKKSYMRSHLLELSFIHTSLADQYAALIAEVSKRCPSLLQKQHLESSDSASPPQVTKMLAPKFSTVTGFDVLWQPGGAGLYLSKRKGSSHSGSESSMSSVNKPPVPPLNDDALKVEESKDSGSESSMSSVTKPAVPPDSNDALKIQETKDSELSSVNKPAVPPVSDDALKVQETKYSELSSVNKPSLPPVSDNALKLEETKDYGSESSMSSAKKPPDSHDDSLKLEETKDYGAGSSMSYVNKSPVAPVIDDVLQGEETTDSGSESSISSVDIPQVSDVALKLEETKDSGSKSSISSVVNKPPAPPVCDDALKVEESKDFGLESSISSLNKPTVPPANYDDLKVEETKGSGSEASMSSVNKPPVPPVSDDALKLKETKDSDTESSTPSTAVPPANDNVLKVKETRDSDTESSIPSAALPPANDNTLKVEETKDSGSESSMPSVNNNVVPPVSDDGLEVTENKDYGSESPMSSVNKPVVTPINEDVFKVEETKDSGSGSSMSSANNPLPVSVDALKVKETKDYASESSMSSVNKPAVVPAQDDALKVVEETKNSDRESSMLSVNKPAVPPVNDDALKVKETKDPGCGGSESSMSSVNEPAVPPVNDNALKVEETEDPEALLEKISILEEEVARMKQKLKSLTDENGELKEEIEENIADVKVYMSETKLERDTIEEELKASEDIAIKIDEHAARVLEAKLRNQSKHDYEITEMNMKILQYMAEISQLKSTHEKKEKIWNGVTGQLKKDLKEKCDLVDELNKNMSRKDDQLEILWDEKRSQDILIEQLKTELKSVKSENVELVSSFDTVQKLADELKLKVLELEREVELQREAMSNKE